MFILPHEGKVSVRIERVEQTMPGLPSGVVQMFEYRDGTCGGCTSFEHGFCTERGCLVAETDPECLIYSPR